MLCRSRIFLHLVFFSSAVLLTMPEQVCAAGMSGLLLEYIQPTSAMDAFFIGRNFTEHSSTIGFSRSPSIQGSEMGDALYQFADVNAAMNRLEAIKRQHGFTGGKVFAGFTYDDRGHTELECGVSRSEARTWDEVNAGAVAVVSEHTRPVVAPDPGLFRQFKKGSRQERVRLIARCLAGLPGMPPLKSSRQEITGLFVDENSYRVAENWFKKNDVIGLSSQYRQAFRCLLTAAGKSLDHASGTTLVVKTSFSYEGQKKVRETNTDGWTTQERVESTSVNWPLMIMAVTDLKMARELHEDSDIFNMDGPWPTRYKASDNSVDTIEPLIGSEAIKVLPGCLKKAGLVPSEDFLKGLNGETEEPLCKNGCFYSEHGGMPAPDKAVAPLGQKTRQLIRHPRASSSK